VKTLIAAIVLTSYLALNPALGQQSTPATASDVKPTDQSIHQLLGVMQAKALVEAIPQQMDAYFTSTLNQILEGKPISAEQQQAIDKMRQKLNDMMKENFNWESMEAIYLEVYRKTFSQSEIDSMINFYSSPAGHAVVVKLPLAMQNAMAVVQQRMQTLIPKIQQMAKDTAEEIKAPQEGAPKAKTG
jgi:hypothetical protein